MLPVEGAMSHFEYTRPLNSYFLTSYLYKNEGAYLFTHMHFK
jgi:hypothetical protein